MASEHNVRYHTESRAGLHTIVATHKDPQLNVVFLHGYSMQPEDFAPFAASLGLPAHYYFPRAPLATEPQGATWWPIDSAERAARIAQGHCDLANIYPTGRVAAREQLTEFCNSIRASDNPFASLPLVVGGFSQGGMLACDSVLCANLSVDGLALLSASRIAIDDWQHQAHRLKNVATFISHGMQDSVLPFTTGEALHNFAIACHAHVSWAPFVGGHETPLHTWRALRVFFRGIVDQVTATAGSRQ